MRLLELLAQVLDPAYPFLPVYCLDSTRPEICSHKGPEIFHEDTVFDIRYIQIRRLAW